MLLKGNFLLLKKIELFGFFEDCAENWAHIYWTIEFNKITA